MHEATVLAFFFALFSFDSVVIFALSVGAMCGVVYLLPRRLTVTDKMPSIVIADQRSPSSLPNRVPKKGRERFECKQHLRLLEGKARPLLVSPTPRYIHHGWLATFSICLCE